VPHAPLRHASYAATPVGGELGTFSELGRCLTHR
jgi:hypothetical protein